MIWLLDRRWRCYSDASGCRIWPSFLCGVAYSARAFGIINVERPFRPRSPRSPLGGMMIVWPLVKR
jgi:hypothetical protein